MAKKKSTSTTSKKKVAEKSATPSNDSLLEYAMGTKPIEEIIPEKYWIVKPIDKEFFLYRREARRAIYKIIKYMRTNVPIEDPKLIEMQALINSQLSGDMGLNWGNFTTKWDLHPKDVTKIVLKEHWLKEGGGFDVDLGVHSPTAFTGQNLK